jgi:phosphatidylglycerophosphate synthase
MSKLSKENKFIDFSDYGRPIAKICAKLLKNTSITPVHVTFVFGICGLIAVYCILHKLYFPAAFFLLLKSIIDAVDGELARVKKMPSYTGRYLDSIFDILLNFLFLLSIGFVIHTSIWLILLAFIAIQLQGTLYNYYYVILRTNSIGGDSTSKITETSSPKAFPLESQKMVNILYHTYNILYIIFDKAIYYADAKAINLSTLPNWFMTLVSFFGLGTQLLIMALFLVLNCIDYILPFFIAYTVFIIPLIVIRRTFLKESNNL